MPAVSVRSRGTSVAVPPAARMASSSSSSPPTVRATATTWAPARASASAVAAPMPREAPVTRAMRPERRAGRLPAGLTTGPSARLRQERQLPRRRLAGAVGQRGRIFASEAVVGELRAYRVAADLAHGAVDAVDREEGEGIGADDRPHLLDGVGRGQELVALRGVDAVEIGMGDRRRGDAEMHLL